MTRVALKSLASHKFRALLTALAIVLGTAMVSGTYVLTDSVTKAFEVIFTRSYEASDAFIEGREAFSDENALPPSFDASLLERVRSLDETDAAAGGIADFAQLVGKDGESIGGNGPPTLAFGIDRNRTEFSPLSLAAGTWPRGPDEIAIDKGTADDEGFAVGERIRVSAKGPLRSFRVSGIVRFGGLASLGGATISVFDLPTAQRIFDKEGRLDTIAVRARQDVTPQRLVDEIRAILPPNAKVQTGTQQAAQETEDTNEFLSILQDALLAFGGIALFVGAFIIFNSLSITVAQRAREFALLRTIGASRRQILGTVVLEAAIIGLLASIAGLFLGLALAKALNAIFVSFGIDLPRAGLVFQSRTVVVTIVVGTLITLLASLVPAVRATRVPPIAVLREGSLVPHTRFSRFVPYIAVVVAGLGVALLALGLFEQDLDVTPRLLYLGGGCFLVFIGIALFSPKLVRPLAAVIAAPAAAVDPAPGRLARDNATRNPGRTAVTAAALMIGVTLVTFVAVFAQGLKHSFRVAIEDQLQTDYVVTSKDGFTPFDPSSTGALDRVPGTIVSDVRGVRGRALGSTRNVTGLDTATILRSFDFEWVAGSDAAVRGLGRDGAVVTQSFAEDKALELGDRFSIQSSQGGTFEVVVRGIYEPPVFLNLLGAISVSRETVDANWLSARNLYTFVRVPRVDETTETALARALAPWPDERVRTQEAYVEKQLDAVDQTLNILFVLLALSVIVSIFGIVNTLVLSVFERTRELGMLRAIGTTRWQVARMIAHESMTTALIGAVLGLALGVGLSALVTLSLEDEGLTFSVPWATLVVFTVVAGLCGIAAAIVPAWRAARLNALAALQYE
jgi:putative ABC transport system permease protein